MATTLEELEVIIDLNAWKFNEEIKGVRKELNNLNTTTTKVGRTINSSMTGSVFKGALAAQFFTGAIKKVGNAIFNMGKEVMKGGNQLSRMRIATNTVARNLGITTAEVDNLRRSLEDANTYGVKAERVINSLARSGLYELAKELTTVDARTGETAKGVNALVLTMKDLAAVAGIDSSEGISRLSDFIVSGNTSATAGMIAIGDLGMEYRDFAKTLGKTGAELSAQEQAFVRMQIVQREGKKALGAYAESYTTAGKMFGSIGDSISSTFEELGSSLEPLFATVANAVLTFTNAIKNWVLDNAETIKQWAINVAGWVVWLVRVLGSVLTKLPVIGSRFKSLENFKLKSAVVSVEALSGATQDTANSLDNATGSAKALKKELAGLASFDEMNVLKPPEEASGGGAGVGGLSLGGAGASLGGGLGLDDIPNQINEVADSLQVKFGNVLPIIEKVATALGTVALAVGAIKLAMKGLTIVEGIGTSFKTLGTALGLVGSAGLPVIAIIAGIAAVLAIVYTQSETFRESVKKLADVVGKVLSSAFEIFKTILGTLWAVLQPIVNVLGVVLSAVLESIAILLEPVIDALDIFGGMFEFVGEQVKFVMEYVGEFLKVLAELIGAVIKTAATFVSGLFSFLSPWADITQAKKDSEDASKDLKMAEEDLLVAKQDLTVANGNLADAELSLMDAQKRQADAAALVTKLEKEGKTGTDEYRRAVLELESANGRLVTAEQRVKEKKEEVAVATDNLNIATLSHEDALKKEQKAMDNLNSKNAVSVADQISQKWKEMGESIEGVWDKFGDSAKSGLNKAIGWINRMIAKINSIKLPDFLGGGSVYIKPITPLATGGIVESPTLAMIGEAGREVVMPLDRNTEWIDQLASKLNGKSGGVINLTVQIGDDKVGEKIIDYINDKSLTRGGLVLNI